jgi:hypothetical protein
MYHSEYLLEKKSQQKRAWAQQEVDIDHAYRLAKQAQKRERPDLLFKFRLAVAGFYNRTRSLFGVELKHPVRKY